MHRDDTVGPCAPGFLGIGVRFPIRGQLGFISVMGLDQLYRFLHWLRCGRLPQPGDRKPCRQESVGDYCTQWRGCFLYRGWIGLGLGEGGVGDWTTSLKVSFRNSCSSGNSHRVWIWEPSSSQPLQERGDSWDLNVEIFEGVRYHSWVIFFS